MSYRCAAAGVEEKVGSVGSNRRLVGDWPVAQCHANDGGHVSFCAKDVDGDPGGLACREPKRTELNPLKCISRIKKKFKPCFHAEEN